VMGRGDLAVDAALMTATGRVAQRDRIDRAVGEWLLARDPREAARLMQAARVPAGGMLRVSELPEFAFFRERAGFRTVRHPDIANEFLLEGPPVHSQRLPDPPMQPAPRIGAHTAEIARTLLGLSDAEITRLIGTGVLECTAPVPAVAA
jgi:crotonobetainyl-CoA:carnitine CoA-transferase CaiB-like acyl-CoA transferase